MDSASGERNPTIDNTTPLRKKDLQNPGVVKKVQELGDNPTSATEDKVKRANEGSHQNSLGMGGESNPTQQEERGGPTSGQLSGGVKGMGGSGASGPFQSESGMTLKTDRQTMQSARRG